MLECAAMPGDAVEDSRVFKCAKIAGPLADADAATRLCAALTSVRVACRPSTFNGQRLDLR